MTDTIKTKYLPQFFPSFWIEEYGIVGLPFVEDISIGFVEKENGAYSYLLKDNFPALNISLTDLLKISIQNLEKEFEDCEIKQFQLEGGSLVFWNSDDDNFTAVRFLSSKYLSVLKNIFKDDFYFSITDRDLITCWQTTDKDELNKFQNEAIEDFENSDYGLSSKVYKFEEIILHQ